MEKGSCFTIYIAEDDKAIRDMLVYSLQDAGFLVEAFCNADLLVEKAFCVPCDLILLDIMMDGKLDGIGALEALRKNPITRAVKIIMVSALNDEKNKIGGLERGADDYITKPFSVAELIARVKTNLRDKGQAVIASGEIEINLTTRVAFVKNQQLVLTEKEFDILAVLLQNVSSPISREQIFYKVWGQQFFNSSRVVDVHINKLREKLKGNSKRLESIRGVGYRLNQPP